MRATTLGRRLGPTALAVLLGLGVASCTDDGGSGDPSSSTAADSTDDATDDSSAEPTDKSGADGQATLTELSVDDFYPSVMAAMREAETFRFETTSDAGGQQQTMSGQARYSDDGLEMKASSTGARAMELILLGRAMYMKSPDFGTGDTWVRIDLSDPHSLFGMIGRAPDPEVMFKAMQAPKRLELIGTEDVDGVATHHYRITMDPAQYLDAMEFPSAMEDMLPDELVTEMWVDRDNLPRRFAQTIEVPAMGGGTPTTSSTQGTYSDFGADVEIEAPPADQVTESLPGAA